MNENGFCKGHLLFYKIISKVKIVNIYDAGFYKIFKGVLEAQFVLVIQVKLANLPKF